MSKLRKTLYKIAEEYVDPETGEILNAPPVNKEDLSIDDRLRNVVVDTKKSAQSSFTDSKYYNMYGKVSPFNVIFVDNINSICAMDPQSAGDAIINIIEGLNTTFADDKTYDYVSKSYMNELKMNLSKLKTIDKIVSYLTNIYFAGMGMGSGKKRYASIASVNTNEFTLDISKKLSIQSAIIALGVYLKTMK